MLKGLRVDEGEGFACTMDALCLRASFGGRTSSTGVVAAELASCLC